MIVMISQDALHPAASAIKSLPSCAQKSKAFSVTSSSQSGC
jgi:hypothetical protein